MPLGIYKKLLNAGKKKGCEKVALWARSVCNHMYWCATSSPYDQELIVSKWKSITNHVANIHEGHYQNFKKCEHGGIAERAWMVPGKLLANNTLVAALTLRCTPVLRHYSSFAN